MISFLFALALHLKSRKTEGCVNLRYMQVVYTRSKKDKTSGRKKKPRVGDYVPAPDLLTVASSELASR